MVETQALRIETTCETSVAYGGEDALEQADPALTIIDIDFDDSRQKPVDGESLLSTLAQHLDARDTDDRLDEFDSVVETDRAIERGD